MMGLCSWSTTRDNGGVRIEPATEGDVSGWHTSSGAAYRRGGEIGHFGCNGQWPT
jgi:hypothetical protein